MIRKILLIIGLVVILAGIFLIKFFTTPVVPSVTTGPCSSANQAGCNRSCQQDIDCKGTCGCGAININETCRNECLGITGPGPTICKKQQCSFKLEFADQTGVPLGWWERILPNFGLWFSEAKNIFYELKIKICTKEVDTGDGILRQVPCF